MRSVSKFVLIICLALPVTSFIHAAEPDDYIAVNGVLSVDGTRLVNKHGFPVQLRGMSSHGLHWYPEFTRRSAVGESKKRGANVFRLAMYADSREGGYSESPETARRNTRLLFDAIENVLSAGMYVIVDWHTLKDANPLHLAYNAVLFFEEVARKYPGHPAILYEICNEPNGDTTWEDIRTYAEIVIPVIRSISPEAIVLVGTPKWSSDVLAVLDDPLAHENVMYTYHLYTGDTDYDFTYKLDRMRSMGLPVFVSEWGVGSESKKGELDLEEAKAFIRYMDDNMLSWTNWSLSNKDEDFSALRPHVTKLDGWETGDLTESGKLVFEALGGQSTLSAWKE